MAENTPAGRNLGVRVAATDRGDVLTYSLSGADAGSFDINRATGQLTTKAALDFEMAVNQGTNNEYAVTVMATDPFGANDSANVTITVTDVNEDPTVSGAASIDHAENGTVLDTDAEPDGEEAAVYTATDEDADDDAETDTGLKWTLSGADASKFEITTTGDMRTLSFESAPDFESPGDSGRNNVYEVTVEVTDSEGNSDEQDVTVKVTNVEEDGVVTLSTLQPRVGFPVTATLADPDNITAGSVSWQWYRGGITINTDDLNNGLPEECEETTANSCAIKDAASDTYTPVADDINDTLTAVATYTDGSPNEGDAKDVVGEPGANTVLADTRNKAPVFEDQDDEMEGEQTDQERSVMENTAASMNVGVVVVATDFITSNAGVETPEILTYSLGGPDADSFTIDRGTAQISTKAELDAETKDTYTVTVTATDPSDLQATITVTINVTGVDEAPEIMVGGLAISGMARVDDYAENGTDMVATYRASGPDADMATWTLEGDDAGDFMIEGSGMSVMLKFRSAPDYETPADADMDNTYMVTVKATDGTYTDTHAVTVMVTNVEEAPEFDSATPTRSVAENTAAGMYIGAAVAATDAENDTLTYTLGGDDAASFDFDEATGQLVTKAPLDFETKASYTVEVTATDDTGESDTVMVTVMVTNMDEMGTVTLPAMQPSVGTPIIASLTDVDGMWSSVTWQWASSDAMDVGYTDIEGATSASYMPVEADVNMYLRATAMYTDGHGPGKSASEVSASMVRGLAISGMMSVDYAENGTDAVATYMASGPDASMATWTLEGDDAGQFSITNGMLMFMSAPDYENPADADMDNTYMVTVKATDGTYTAMRYVTVMVTNVDELETVTLSAVQPQIGTEITAELIGGDAISGDVMWQWAKAESKGANYAPIPGATSAAYTPVVADGDMYLRATAMYTDVHEAGKILSAVSENMVRGLAISGMDSVEYAENGTDAVETYVASGPDADMATWSLEGDDAEDFAISSSGELTFVSAPDYETPADADMDNTYMVTVTVKATGGTYMAMPLDVVVTVTDVDEEVIGGTLLETYDADDSGMIEKSEVITAINDYLFDETISRADVIEVINLYLFG